MLPPTHLAALPAATLQPAHPVRVIQRIVAAEFGCSAEIFTAPSRRRIDVYPRFAAMLLAREFTRCSLQDIAGRFGRGDHTTVVHAVRRAALLEREFPDFAAALQAARAACALAFPARIVANLDDDGEFLGEDGEADDADGPDDFDVEFPPAQTDSLAASAAP